MSNEEFLPVLREGDSVTFGDISGCRTISFVNLLIIPVEGSVLIEINTNDTKIIGLKKVIETDTVFVQKANSHDYKIDIKLGDEKIFTSYSLIEGTVRVIEGSCKILKTKDFMHDN